MATLSSIAFAAGVLAAVVAAPAVTPVDAERMTPEFVLAAFLAPLEPVTLRSGESVRVLEALRIAELPGADPATVLDAIAITVRMDPPLKGAYFVSPYDWEAALSASSDATAGETTLQVDLTYEGENTVVEIPVVLRP